MKPLIIKDCVSFTSNRTLTKQMCIIIIHSVRWVKKQRHQKCTLMVSMSSDLLGDFQAKVPSITYARKLFFPVTFSLDACVWHSFTAKCIFRTNVHKATECRHYGKCDRIWALREVQHDDLRYTSTYFWIAYHAFVILVSKQHVVL